jgi:hypothetical protein
MLVKFYAAGNHCDSKALSEFQAMEKRFDSLDDCCRAKFPQRVSDCCESHSDGCSLSGEMKFIPVSVILLLLQNYLQDLNDYLYLFRRWFRDGKIRYVSKRIRTFWQIGNKHLLKQLYESAANTTCIMMSNFAVRAPKEVANNEELLLSI